MFHSDEEIIRLFERGFSREEIEKATGLRWEVIQIKLKRNGIETNKPRLTDEEIIKMYNEGIPYKVMEKIVGMSTRGIRLLLNRNGIETNRVGNKKYRACNDFFKTWTHEMAWVLGMFVTDGCMSKKETSISFSQKDKEILKIIKKIMGVENEIHTYNGVSILVVNSVELALDLIKLGITPHKSRIVPFPEVPTEFLPSFVRGVIDGDGWVHPKGYVMNVTSASEDFAKGLLSVFQSWDLNSEITTELTKAERPIYRIWVRGKKEVPKLAEIIYKDCTGNLVNQKREKMLTHVTGQMAFF